MKVAILIQCHKNPGQINRLLKVMEHRDVEFFLHIDLKSTMEKDIAKRKDVHILPKRLRVKVAWGGTARWRQPSIYCGMQRDMEYMTFSGLLAGRIFR